MQVLTTPTPGLTVDNNFLCTGDCATVTLDVQNIGIQQVTAFYSIEDVFGNTENRTTIFEDFTAPLTEEFCEGIGLLSDNVVTSGNTYTITFDSMVITSENCAFYPNLSVIIEVGQDKSFLIEDSFCADTMIIVGADIYNMDNQDGMTILTAVNGCDSLVTVDLEFLSSIPGLFNNTYCEGDVITILGVEYTETYSGDTLLQGASTSGCDSLVTLDLEFLASVTGSFSKTYCEGDTITILGVEYTDSFLGDTLLQGVSANGCDSLVTLDLTFLEMGN